MADQHPDELANINAEITTATCLVLEMDGGLQDLERFAKWLRDVVESHHESLLAGPARTHCESRS